MMLSEKETAEIRSLAKEIRALKEPNYDAITWEAAIEQVVSVKSDNEDDYFRKIALIGYFLDEERMAQITDLPTFLESLPLRIADLKRRARDYAISTAERLKLRKNIDCKLANSKFPTNDKEAEKHYQLLIQKAFTCVSLDQLLSVLCDLSAVLQEFYPKAYPDAHIIAKHHKKIPQIAEIAGTPLTKKEISATTEIDQDDLGLIMYRFAQLGIFKAGKKGRFNTYQYVSSTIDTNILRKEWHWLWSSPYRKLES
jgi:hypothetical protein